MTILVTGAAGFIGSHTAARFLERGEPVLFLDFIKGFERLTGRKVPVVDAPRPEADVERTHANINKARRLLGYDPRVSVEEGSERFLAWYERAVGKLVG